MKKAFFSILTVLLAFPSLGSAAEFVGGKNIQINQVFTDDIYAGGQVIQVNEPIEGDLIAAGGQINVEAQVSGDLNAFSENLWIRADVMDDVRVAAGDVKLDSSITGDLLVASSTLNLSGSSVIGGDLIFASGNAVLAGNIKGDVKGMASIIYINGLVEGNVRIHEFDRMEFGPNARIQGDLIYRHGEQLNNLPEDRVEGEITYQPSRFNRESASELRDLYLGFSFYGFLTTLFFGLFLIWIYRYYSMRSNQVIYRQPFKSLGIGILTLILTPFVVLILMISAIGLPMGLFLLGIWFILLYLGMISAAMAVGGKLIRIDEKSGFLRLYGSFVLGALILSLLNLLPVIGWLVKCIFVLIGVGGLVIYKYELIGELRKKKIL